MPTLDEIYKQFEDDAKLEYKRCSICGAWMNGISHTRSEKVCAELESLRADNAKLREALEAITERAEAVSEGIVVEKRNPGVSQAKHVSHMANHLAQHAKIARRVLEENSHAR